MLLLLVCPVDLRRDRADRCPDKDASFAADHAYVKEHYTKYEYTIPMRDGVTLFTAAYVPKDASRTYPILLQRTPYGLRPYGASNYPHSPRGPLKYYAKEAFIFVYQDVRGRNGSEGEFVHVRPHLVRQGTEGHRREHRHVRHDRLAGQERAAEQRQALA